MGQGGNITLVNGTTSDWHRRTHTHEYQLDAWDFPATIKAGTSVSVYVEWHQGPFTHEGDDAGEVSYALVGTNFHFQVQARAKSGFTLQVCLSNLPTLNYPKGTTIPLGWDWNDNPSGGYVTFVLAGEPDYYQVSGADAGSWLQQALPVLGALPLRQLCLPGSHDAGMSIYTSGTAFAHACNSLTQTTGILGQLQYGARYFDIRPVISAGQYYTGHYSDLGSWQGANGQSLDAIIADINTYTATHPELIILNLSHDLNTDVGSFSYRPFTQPEWDALFAKLQTLSGLFVSAATDLSTLPLQDFIYPSYAQPVVGPSPDQLLTGPPPADKRPARMPQAAVVVIVEPTGITLPPGFYPYTAFDVYNHYAEKNDVTKMAADQFSKLQQQRPTPTAPPFLLSWTLTQNGVQASTCSSGASNSILTLASIADPQLYVQLPGACTPQCYPNILYLDALHDAAPAALARAINTQAR